MQLQKFKLLYKQLTTKDIIQQGKFLNNVLAGTAATAITAGSVLGLNKLSEIQTPIKSHEPTTSITQTYEQPEVPSRQICPVQQNSTHQNYWIKNITMPFIISWEGKVLNNKRLHVLYDDDVHTKVKRRWNGVQPIEEFIASCKGKPTIGYGETDKDIIRKGTLTDAEAKALLLRRIVSLHNHLNQKYMYFKTMNPNQKTALISFSYNLGRDFIEDGTKKMKAHLKAGRLFQMCDEMRDCDNITQNGELVKVKGLTNRRLAEMQLFRTPFK